MVQAPRPAPGGERRDPPVAPAATTCGRRPVTSSRWPAAVLPAGFRRCPPWARARTPPHRRRPHDHGPRAHDRRPRQHPGHGHPASSPRAPCVTSGASRSRCAARVGASPASSPTATSWSAAWPTVPTRRTTTAGEVTAGVPVAVEADDCIERALQLMATKRVRRLPVVDQGRLVGDLHEAAVAVALPAAGHGIRPSTQGVVAPLPGWCLSNRHVVQKRRHSRSSERSGVCRIVPPTSRR